MQQRKRVKLKLRDSCDGCSDAKIKCNKDKPACSRCNVKGLTCCYGPSHRSGRRSTTASKASERPQKSPTSGPVPALAQVAAPAPQPAGTSNEIHTTAALNAASNTDFNFSIDVFDFPDIALSGAASGTTPFSTFPEPLKMDLSAPEYDVAALMSLNPDLPNDNYRKSDIENSSSSSSSSSSNDSLTYDNRNDSISSGVDGMTYDPQWFSNLGLTFPSNFASGLGMPPSSSYAPRMTLPDISTPSSLQSSIFNHQSFPLPNTNAIFCTPPPETSCTCLTQALSLLAALHDNNNASSTSSTPPVIGTLTPPYADNNNNNSTISLRNLVGGGTGVKSATTIHESLNLNTTSLQQATTILSCECSTHNQQLVFFVAFIALKTMDRYTAAAHGADTLDRDSGGGGGSDLPSSSKDGLESSGGGKDNSRARAQLVLGELHRVVRIVDTLSKRMREVQGRRVSSSSGWSSQSGGGKGSEVGGGGLQGGPGGYDISASCFAQLENDLRKHLKAVTNDTMAILRRD